MRASIRSRLAASTVAFGLGFAAANVGILLMADPDRLVWLAVAALLIATAGIGVGFADTRRRLSIWAVLGVEAFVIFTVGPLVWMFRLATMPSGDRPTSLLPREIDWTGFARALDDAALGSAMTHSLLAGSLATVVAVPVGFGAAAALVRRRPPGHRQVRRLLPALVLAPLVVWAVPMADQARRLGLPDSPLVTGAGLLVVTVPLAAWLAVGVYEQAGRDRVDAPSVPAVLAVIAATFVAGCLDFVVGAALSAVHRPLAVTMLGEGDARLVAASGLIWLALTGGVIALCAPVLMRLVGRSD
jgi:hypothetical protein